MSTLTAGGGVGPLGAAAGADEAGAAEAETAAAAVADFVFAGPVVVCAAATNE
jgi:hypothetical protein